MLVDARSRAHGRAGSRKALVEFAACWCALSRAGKAKRRTASEECDRPGTPSRAGKRSRHTRLESATWARRSRCLADERTAAYCTMSVKPLQLRQFDRWRAFGGFDQLHKGEPSTFM